MQSTEIRGSALLECIRSYSIIYHCNLFITLSNFVFSLCLCAIIEFSAISSVLFYARCTCKKLSFTFGMLMSHLMTITSLVCRLFFYSYK